METWLGSEWRPSLDQVGDLLARRVNGGRGGEWRRAGASGASGSSGRGSVGVGMSPPGEGLAHSPGSLAGGALGGGEALRSLGSLGRRRAVGAGRALHSLHSPRPPPDCSSRVKVSPTRPARSGEGHWGAGRRSTRSARSAAASSGGWGGTPLAPLARQRRAVGVGGALHLLGSLWNLRFRGGGPSTRSARVGGGERWGWAGRSTRSTRSAEGRGEGAPLAPLAQNAWFWLELT